MLSIFNGEERTLGAGASSTTYMKIKVDFRQHLHHFKGARLGVFMAIALHCDEHGWSFPSIATIKRETGYNEDTISKAIHDLCHMEIDGCRVLLAIIGTTSKGTFTSNRYLIFPSPEEVTQYAALSPHTKETPYREKPATVKPSTENQSTKKNHSKPKPVKTTTMRDRAAGAAGGGGKRSKEKPTEAQIYLNSIGVKSKECQTQHAHTPVDALEREWDALADKPLANRIRIFVSVIMAPAWTPDQPVIKAQSDHHRRQHEHAAQELARNLARAEQLKAQRRQAVHS